MRTIFFLIRKEFIQIFRDKFIGKAIFMVPIVQMLILVPAVTFEIRNVKLCIVDRDMSAESMELISRLEGSTFFKVKYSTFSEEKANDLMSLSVPPRLCVEYGCAGLVATADDRKKLPYVR